MNAAGSSRRPHDFSGSYIDAVDSNIWAFGTGDFTVEFWANFDATTTGDIVHDGAIPVVSEAGTLDRAMRRIGARTKSKPAKKSAVIFRPPFQTRARSGTPSRGTTQKELV